MKGMLHKDPEKRVQLIDIMTLPYFIIDDTELEDKLAQITQAYSENKSKEEEKLEKSM